MKTIALIPLLSTLALYASASQWDGSRTVPVHRIPLVAEDGSAIVPSLPSSMPFSARKTCGACHAYDVIATGWHFNAGNPGVDDGRPGQPWVATDESLGIQVPVGLRDWPGLHKLSDMGLTPWEFTKRFGSHLPGGGISDPVDKPADPNARWDISGGFEINCLACHNGSQRQDMSEMAKQIGRENFRWAATAASGIGEVGGMASRMQDWWNVYMGESPDDHVYAVPPSVTYDTTLFDSRRRVWLEIERPQSSACLHCHSVHLVGEEREDVAGDVHTAAGLECYACHESGLNHATVRGAPGDPMTCEGCHTEHGTTPGKFAAPIAAHAGIPPVHFAELTCTACHSGAALKSEPQLIRTARANRLGVHGRAQWFTEAPYIVEPVFVQNAEGKIEPRRMVWPAFWGETAGAGIRPLAFDEVESIADGILGADSQVAAVLRAFSSIPDAPGEPLFVADGKLYTANLDGGLDLVGEHVSASAWVWRTETNIVSTIPEFDVNAEELEVNAENRIIAIMEALDALVPKQPLVVVVKGKLFSRGESGYLEGVPTQAGDGWYRKAGDELGALVSPFVVRVVLDTVGTGYVLNEEQVGLMLKSLLKAGKQKPVYIANGRKFSLSADGALLDEDDAAAEPVSYPLGHDVRPAATAMGAKSCKECHAPDSNFFFSRVTATGPLKTERAKVKPMYEFQDIGKQFHKMFGFTFIVRKYFKMMLAAFTVVLVLMLLAVSLPAVLAGLGIVNGWLGGFSTLIVLVTMLPLAGLALTGFVFGWPVSSPLNGFPLLGHVGLGAAYAVMLCAAVAVAAKSKRGPLAHACFWLVVACGVVLILSVLLAMFPIFGTHGQHLCVLVHRAAAVVTLVAAGVGCVAARKTNG